MCLLFLNFLQTASIVSEWNLICDDDWKVSAADSMFFGGFFCAFFHIDQISLFGQFDVVS